MQREIEEIANKDMHDPHRGEGDMIEGHHARKKPKSKLSAVD